MTSGWRFALIAVLTALVLALALASCGDDKTAGDERTLTYYEGRGQVDFGEGQRPGGRPVPGGVVSGSVPLEDADGNAVGDENLFCIVTGSEEGGTHTCSGTVDLPNGQLNIAYGGDIKGPPPGGSITGGTGDYAGATGTYEVVLPPREEGPPPPGEEGQPPPPGEGPKRTFTFTLP